MALNNFSYSEAPPLKSISGREHKIKKTLSNVTASVAQKKWTVKFLKMYNVIIYYVPV